MYSGIDFKFDDIENWFILASYWVGIVVCLPAGFILSIMPDRWLTVLGPSIVNALLAFLSVAFSFFVFFFSTTIRVIKKGRQK